MRVGWIVVAMLAGLATQSIAAERVRARDNVPVISGGVGEDSVARLQAREKEFNLKLVFALVEGNYVADVGVMISDAAGKELVQHVTDGPIFMARLPAGTYVVTAYYNGIAQARKVSVRGERLHTEYLRWPSNPQVAGLTKIKNRLIEFAQASLLAREKEFNLKVVFTLVEGNYVSGVGVEVKNASGKTVISHVTDGPFFLARLPAGTYSLTAAYDGQTQARTVSVVAGHLRTEYIRWKSNPQADTVLPPER